MKNTAQTIDWIEEAERARDEALAQVIANGEGWNDMARAFAFTHIPFDRPLTAEEIRLLLCEQGLASPHHHNAWGAFFRGIVVSGLVSPTGVHRSMRTTKSHARKTPEYIRRKN